MSAFNDSASRFGVTKSDFDEWRHPREGDDNPTRMDNKVWQWLIATRISGYQAAAEMKAERSRRPTWSFDRYGQSRTTLPDGRIVHIGGEHEDHYDPDFHIYNDVVVDKEGELSIFGYPTAVFPPTDFHSATLVGSHIYVIGALGYAGSRGSNIEAVYALDTKSFSMTKLATSGDAPPWLHGQTALLSSSEDSITVTGGLIYRGPEMPLVESVNGWSLTLDSLTWKQTPRNQWRHWVLWRSDKKPSYLWDIRRALWYKDANWHKELKDAADRISTQIGKTVELDGVDALYRPHVPHDYIGPDQEQHGTHRSVIDRVVVRVVEDMHAVQVIAEGKLPEQMLEQYVSDVRARLSDLENMEYEVERLA